MTLKEAYDAWRGVPFNPDRPVGTILSDRELVLTQDAFKAGALYASDEARREAEGAYELLLKAEYRLTWALERSAMPMRDWEREILEGIRAHLKQYGERHRKQGGGR